MDGLEVEEACAMEFPDLHGKLKAYKGDIRYDVYDREYVRIDGTSGKAVHYTINTPSTMPIKCTLKEPSGCGKSSS